MSSDEPRTLGNGIVLHFLGGNCPVYGEGTVDGQTFTFTARGTTLRFACGAYTAKETYAVDDDHLSSVQAYNAQHGRAALDEDTIRNHAAGWIEEAEAETAILRFVDAMRATQAPTA